MRSTRWCGAPGPPSGIRSWRRTTYAGRARNYAVKRAGNWSKYSYCSGTPPSRPPKVLLRSLLSKQNRLVLFRLKGPIHGPLAKSPLLRSVLKSNFATKPALSHLGHELARSTIAAILERHGLEPAPERNRKATWKEFLARHWELIVAADFFTVEVWTRRGLQRFLVLFFIDLSTRKVELGGIASTANGL